jgi:hypothetical protein
MCSAAAVPYFVSLSAHAAQEKPFGLLSTYALRGDTSPWNIPTFEIPVQVVIKLSRMWLTTSHGY